MMQVREDVRACVRACGYGACVRASTDRSIDRVVDRVVVVVVVFFCRRIHRSIDAVRYFLGYQAGYFAKDPARSFVAANAAKKCGLDFGVAVLRGVGANWLVCLGWWQAWSAARDDTVSKVGWLVRCCGGEDFCAWRRWWWVGWCVVLVGVLTRLCLRMTVFRTRFEIVRSSSHGAQERTHRTNG